MNRPVLSLRPGACPALRQPCSDASGHRAGAPLPAAEPRPVSTATRLPADTAPVHDARALTGGGQEARIVLDGAVYTLRVTRQRKLILTK